MVNQIYDERHIYMGWSETVGGETLYYHAHGGLVGKYVKSAGRYLYLSGPKKGQWGPYADIGPSEVLNYKS